MNYQNATFAQIKTLIRLSLKKLYRDDKFLFERNGGKGICERSLVFRFGHHLQIVIDDYFVDCDYNSSAEGQENVDRTITWRDRHGKIIPNLDGTTTKRFVDIIVHRRRYEKDNNFIVVECKKWNNLGIDDVNKDLNNLRIMTQAEQYGYRYGFHIIFGSNRDSACWTIFENGQVLVQKEKVFPKVDTNRHPIKRNFVQRKDDTSF